MVGVAYLVDIGVPDFSEEANAGRRIRVVWWKLHVRLQQQTHKFDRQMWMGLPWLATRSRPTHSLLYTVYRATRPNDFDLAVITYSISIY